MFLGEETWRVREAGKKQSKKVEEKARISDTLPLRDPLPTINSSLQALKWEQQCLEQCLQKKNIWTPPERCSGSLNRSLITQNVLQRNKLFCNLNDYKCYVILASRNTIFFTFRTYCWKRTYKDQKRESFLMIIKEWNSTLVQEFHMKNMLYTNKCSIKFLKQSKQKEDWRPCRDIGGIFIASISFAGNVYIFINQLKLLFK